MSNNFLLSAPKGEKVGLAFSGGLDTCAALVWMKSKGIKVYTYTADLGQPDETDVNEIKKRALELGAEEARIVDCKEELCAEGIAALQVNAFHIHTAGKIYFNTTPLGRVVTGTMLATAMKNDDVHIWSDGSTHRGNDIERFYRYSSIVNPEIKVYKPWLDEQFFAEVGGRTEMSALLNDSGFAYKMPAEKAYSTDSNVLGGTHEAKEVEKLSTSAKILDPIMIAPFWREDCEIKNETVTVTFTKGIPTAINGKSFKSSFEVIDEANIVGGRHGLGLSDQVENRIIGAKSRGIYEAPGMTLLNIAYDRLIKATHNEDVLENYYNMAYKLGKYLYHGRWLDPESLMLRDCIIRWVSSQINGTVEIELRRGNDYTITNTISDTISYNPDELTMEKSAGWFTPTHRIGQLTLRNAGLNATRNSLKRIYEQEELRNDSMKLLDY